MKFSYSLKIKFVISYVLFTTFLLSSILIYFYVSSKGQIKNRAKQESVYYNRILSEAIQTQIQHTKFELQDLRLQWLSTFPTKKNIRGIKGSKMAPLKKFVSGYPRKYTEIAILNFPKKEKYCIRPLLALNGKIEYVTVHESISQVRSGLLGTEGYSLKGELRMRAPDLALPAHPVQFVLPLFPKLGLYLSASINFDFLIKQSVLDAKCPDSIQPFITDSSGSILYSNNVAWLNQSLFQIFSLPTYFLDECYKNRNATVIIKEDACFHCAYLLNMKSYVGIQRKFASEMEQLNQQIFEAILFAGLIFLIAGVLGHFQLIRMTQSLSEVTRVSNRVAEGDFTEKIGVTRKDELGVLIEAFNQMVDKLDENYHKLNQMNTELKRTIDDLHQAREELSRQERLAIIGETVSKISHEIQNKISGVSIWVQNLEAQADDDSRLYINEIRNALQSFMDLLINFKNFYRLPKLNKEQVEVISLIDSVLKRYGSELSNKKLKVVKKYGSGQNKIYADANLLEEVLLNILLNAVYFSPSGGTIYCSYGVEKGFHFISIEDEGPGVPLRDRKMIFQPFYTNNPSGSGLGLAISYNIIKAHQGSIDYEDGAQGGAKFTIRIPEDKELT